MCWSATQIRQSCSTIRLDLVPHVTERITSCGHGGGEMDHPPNGIATG